MFQRFIPAYAGNATGGRETWSHSTVHPRIRGERPKVNCEAAYAAGSSPHTRGTRKCLVPFRVLTRFIPAYAGNAPRREPRQCPTSVHPRIRGERYHFLIVISSSPRFIPAYAGNASLFQMTSRRSSVHPRIRGERIQKVDLEALGTGSSPHTRGTQRPRPDRGRRERFIPAYAGNARQEKRSTHFRSVHPRIRGERRQGFNPPIQCGGSSPHTRGTHLWSGQVVRQNRFIPAYAGNALAPQDRASQDAVHPRIRGERYTIVHAVRIGDRFIPAYAGNAILASAADKPLKVHPRIRGERCRELDRKYYDSGSSPHTRGTRPAHKSR